jgi:formate dehydrogenase subunit gamma
MTIASQAIKETKALGGAVPREPAEDTVVGTEIQRHRLSARVIHWGVAFSFVGCLLTGMPIWTPLFGWMAQLFGGLAVCRWLHPFLGLAFCVFALFMCVRWAALMVLEPSEWAWFGPKTIEYLRFDHDDPDVGKYNGGQKIFFWFSNLGAVGLLLTGFVLWWPESFGAGLRQASLVLHDLAYIAFAAQLVAHIYLATAAEPGTFRAMISGRVTKAWARVHHARWYRQVTGEQGK